MQAKGAVRALERVIDGEPTSDGAGVRLVRLLGGGLQRRLDPFLMLDAFRSDDPDDYIAGFPEHPHRGFETVTLMVAGRMRHRDSRGNEGVVQGGGAQWMTTGRGILHAEMPEQQSGLMQGYQLWLNLPAAEKMREPWWRDIEAESMSAVDTGSGARVRLVAGRMRLAGSDTVHVGVVERPGTEVLVCFAEFDAGGVLEFALPDTHNALLSPYRGEVRVGAPARPVPEGRMGLLETRAGIGSVRLAATEPAACIVAAGKPLREPIAQYGPFVMNTREELMQAVEDLQAGRLG